MARFTSSIEIARPPEEVFTYLSDLSRHGEWQGQIQEVQVLTEPPTRVGSRAKDHRKPPFGPAVWATYEITAYDPPQTASFRGLDGPMRADGTVTVTPAEGGSKVTLDIDLVGHGLVGKLLAPMARRQMHKEVPLDQQRLKERLESGAAG